MESVNPLYVPCSAMASVPWPSSACIPIPARTTRGCHVVPLPTVTSGLWPLSYACKPGSYNAPIDQYQGLILPFITSYASHCQTPTRQQITLFNS